MNINIKKFKLPIIIVAVGLIVAIVGCLLTCAIKVPNIVEQDFNYSATYKLDGETKTLEGIYRVNYEDGEEKYSPLERYYTGTYISNTDNNYSADHLIAKKDNLELCIVFIFNADSLMGDGESYEEAVEPYLAVYDVQGVEYTDEEYLGKFDVELVSYEVPTPIENSFTFKGFGYINTYSCLVMLVAAALTMLACIIFVKKDKEVDYNVVDIISIVLNYGIVIFALPFITVCSLLMELVVSGEEFLYQLGLFVPMLTTIGIAASIVLRRKGFKMSSLLSQFAGIVLFILIMIIDLIA